VIPEQVAHDVWQIGLQALGDGPDKIELAGQVRQSFEVLPEQVEQDA